MTIELLQELINKHLKNNMGRYNARCLNENWFIKNDLLDFYNNILITTDNIKDRTFGERLWAIEHYPIPICECGNPVKRYDNDNKWSKYCSKKCSLTSSIRAQQISNTKLSIDHTDINIKRANTMIEKYGVAYNSQRPEIKSILSEKQSKNQLSSEIREKLLDYNWVYTNYITNQKTISELSTELNCCDGTVADYIQKHNIEIQQYHKISIAQKQIYNYINDELGILCVYDKTGLLNGKEEIDIFIPDYNIGIELNGLYYHSFATFESKKEKEKLLNKKLKAQENNINLLHITDHQWYNKTNIVKSIINSKLNITNKIYARQCTIINLNSKEEREFIDTNHLQGYIASKVKYGLMFNNELIAIMTFGKPRYDKTYTWELLRYCSKLNTTVVGGFSRLISKFKKEYDGSIITYADYQISNGNVYSKNNFNYIRRSNIGYFWTNGTIVLNRVKCMKNNLHNWLKNFDNTKSEAENMFANNYRRYWNCGQLVFSCK